MSPVTTPDDANSDAAAVVGIDKRRRIEENLARFVHASQHPGDWEMVRGTVDAADPDTVAQEYQRSLGLPVADEVSAADAIAALRLIPGLADVLAMYERTLIEAARDRGETWDSLGEQLYGRTGQALQQRYRRVRGTRTWPTRRRAASTAPDTEDP